MHSEWERMNDWELGWDGKSKRSMKIRVTQKEERLKPCMQKSSYSYELLHYITLVEYCIKHI